MFSSTRRYLWIVAAVLGLFTLLSGPARAQQTEKTFLWKVTSKTNTVYVLGSMHLANKDFFPLAPEIEKAYADSKKLVVEADIVNIDQAKLQKLVLSTGLYPKGESLSKEVSKKTMDTLREYCKMKKTPIDLFELMRPWLVNLTLLSQEMTATGLSPDLGIDMYFLKKAGKEKKPIIELESVEAQIDLFRNMSPELQENMLVKTLEGAGDIKADLEKMSIVWKKGDARAMDEMVFGDTLKKHPEFKALMVKMFDDRNVKMVEKIEGFLKGKEPVFVVVGAGHLVGPKGIVKLLEDKKYQVTQVTTKAKELKKAS